MMNTEKGQGSVQIALKGRIDSNNAAETEQNIRSCLTGQEEVPLLLDASELSYISSAGLRILLRLKKDYPEITITNVSPEVYDILEMTGFTEMMVVEKAYRQISIEGCEVIGVGGKGVIYRIDQDHVVKVYRDENPLEDIRHEREVARLALILGIPTAISYDVVRVGDSYGSVFELLNARPFSAILANDPEKLDWCVQEYVKMLKKIHETVVPEGKLPSMKDRYLYWMETTLKHLPEEAGKKLAALVQAVPQDNHMIHGDYHTKNVELQNDEVLLIDMDTLATGHPVFELGPMYSAFLGFSAVDHETVKRFQGYDYETSGKFWRKTLEAYLGTRDEETVREVEDKARILSYTRLISRAYRHHETETELEKAQIEVWTKELLALLEKTDTLLFTPGEIDVDASSQTLPKVLSFIEEHLEKIGCALKTRMQIGLAAEEIFVNIANYAYAPKKGKARIKVEFGRDPRALILTFTDKGKPYNPLAREDPDVTLSAQARAIGGLGIYLTKKVMDDIEYEYKDGQNILRLKKYL